ncbi:MAG: hypothetical protein ACE5FS_02695 [Paracoccaceae bacterium]
MVRKIGFGDESKATEAGPVRRAGASDKDLAKAESPPAGAGGKAAPAAGRPRWGGIVFLTLFLVPWMVMILLVAAGMLTGDARGAGLYPVIWLLLAVLGAFVLMRKIRHFYRGGSWLRTPEEVAGKSADKTG